MVKHQPASSRKPVIVGPAENSIDDHQHQHPNESPSGLTPLASPTSLIFRPFNLKKHMIIRQNEMNSKVVTDKAEEEEEEDVKRSEEGEGGVGVYVPERKPLVLDLSSFDKDKAKAKATVKSQIPLCNTEETSDSITSINSPSGQRNSLNTEQFRPESNESSSCTLESITSGDYDSRPNGGGKLIAGTASGRDPKCARCRNHNIIKRLKGHKRDCPFKDCGCNDCQLTEVRRSVMAKQVAKSREQKEKSQKQKLEPTPAVPKGTTTDSDLQDPLGRLQNKNGLFIPVDLSGPYKEKYRQLYEQLKERELLQYSFPALVRMCDFNEERLVAVLKAVLAEMENGLSLTQLPASIPSMDFVPPFRIPTHYPALHCLEPSATLPYATGYDGQLNWHAYCRYWMDHNARHTV